MNDESKTSIIVKNAFHTARKPHDSRAELRSNRRMGKKRQLMLLRHAKSAWDNPDLSDHDRPLAPRGVRGAKVIGHFIGQRQLWPDLVLCSSATRALDTYALVERHWGTPAQGRVEITIDRGLYLCGVQGFTEALRQVDDRYRRVMIVAHNPDLHDLALSLARDTAQETDAMQRLRRKFPTAALAVASLAIDNWSGFSAGQASEILLFETPKTIMGDDR